MSKNNCPSDPIRDPTRDLKVRLLTSDFCIVPPRFISLSLLDFQDCEGKSPFLPSTHETLFSIFLSLFFCEKHFIFLERNMHFLDLRFDGKQLCDEVLGGYLRISRFLLKNCELSVPNPLFLSKIEHVLLKFSFSSQNWRKE